MMKLCLERDKIKGQMKMRERMEVEEEVMKRRIIDIKISTHIPIAV